MKERIGMIELWKFIASLLIMGHHKYLFCDLNLFDNCWIYVELFCIISGYFTMLHLSKTTHNTVDDVAKKSISYTISKFSKFLPFTIPALIIQYIFEYINMFGFSASATSIGYFFNAILDFLFIGDKSKEHIAPLWFLFAMFMVFPVFCVLCQMKSKYLLYIITFTLAMFYYKYEGITAGNSFPKDIFRVFTFLLMGVLVFGLVEYIREIKFKKYWKVIFTILEELNILFTIFATCFNKGFESLIVLCFILGPVLLLSKQTYTSKLSGKIFSQLGQISMIIFIIHWTIGNIIGTYLSHLSTAAKFLLYYVITISVAIIFQKIVSIAQKHIKLNKIFLE